MENIIVRHCAPTLAGLKTANLVTCRKDGTNSFKDLFIYRLSEKGVEATVLGEDDDNLLLYVFRRKRLEEDLKSDKVTALLRAYGYTDMSVDGAIEQLKKRIAETPCFPHEIGLFLGYPAEDVKGFIDHKGQNFKCMGYWKVYCNECEAKKTFAKYKKCIDVYTRVYLAGASIDKLTVAV